MAEDFNHHKQTREKSNKALHSDAGERREYGRYAAIVDKIIRDNIDFLHNCSWNLNNFKKKGGMINLW